MALTEEQKAFRRKLIGGSDANIIMSGDPDKVLRLWKEKTGQEEPENLDDELRVQMGVFTEPFNVFWFEKKTARKITNCGDQRINLDHPFMGCTLDGMTDEGETVFEAKHVNEFWKADALLEYYTPQLTHNMLVCGVRKSVLSVFFGNGKWERFEVPLDDIYAAILVGAEEKFWASVKDNVPPVATKINAPVAAVKIVDMTGNNEWANAAVDYQSNMAASKTFEAAQKKLKSLVLDDVVEAYGHGVRLKRDKAGSIRFSGK